MGKARYIWVFPIGDIIIANAEEHLPFMFELKRGEGPSHLHHTNAVMDEWVY